MDDPTMEVGSHETFDVTPVKDAWLSGHRGFGLNVDVAARRVPPKYSGRYPLQVISCGFLFVERRVVEDGAAF